MLILSGSIISVDMTKARIWTRISARVGILFILTLSLSSRLIDVKFYVLLILLLSLLPFVPLILLHDAPDIFDT